MTIRASRRVDSPTLPLPLDETYFLTNLGWIDLIEKKGNDGSIRDE